MTQFQKTENKKNNNPQGRDFCEMQRVIVSLTSIPKRLHYVQEGIRNMCRDQTRLPTHVRLYLPPTFLRSDETYEVPESLFELQKAYPSFRIVEVPEDVGPATKMIYALQEFTDSTDVIISIDDDIGYHERFVEELLDAHAAKPDSLLGFMGTDPPRNPFVHAEFLQYRVGVSPGTPRAFYQVQTLGGYRGILYPRSLIPPDFFDLFDQLNTLTQQECKSAVREDDNFIGSYCTYRHIPMHVCGTFFPGNMFAQGFLEKLNFKFLDGSKIDPLASLTSKTWEVQTTFFANLNKNPKT